MTAGVRLNSTPSAFRVETHPAFERSMHQCRCSQATFLGIVVAWCLQNYRRKYHATYGARLTPQFTPNPSSTPTCLLCQVLGRPNCGRSPRSPHSFGRPQGHWVASHIAVCPLTGHKIKGVASQGHSSLAPPGKLYFSRGFWGVFFLAPLRTCCHASCKRAQYSCQH